MPFVEVSDWDQQRWRSDRVVTMQVREPLRLVFSHYADGSPFMAYTGMCREYKCKSLIEMRTNKTYCSTSHVLDSLHIHLRL